MMMVVVDEENDNDGIGPSMGPRQVKAMIKLMRLLNMYKVKMIGVCKGAGFTIGFGEVIFFFHLLN